MSMTNDFDQLQVSSHEMKSIYQCDQPGVLRAALSLARAVCSRVASLKPRELHRLLDQLPFPLRNTFGALTSTYSSTVYHRQVAIMNPE